ncbi:MAG: hypothetical protein QME06_09145, partial [Desulfobacterales bacterium]|nr:hypothetical protein [Desulfobacterales bacterium]
TFSSPKGEGFQPSPKGTLKKGAAILFLTIKTYELKNVPYFPPATDSRRQAQTRFPSNRPFNIPTILNLN